MTDETTARDRATPAWLEVMTDWLDENGIDYDELLSRLGVRGHLATPSKGEHAEGLAGEELPFLVRTQIGEAVRAIVDRWHAAGSPTDPEVLRALAAASTADVAHFRDCIGDIADSYISDPIKRAELIDDVMTTAREVQLADAPEGVDAPPHPDPCSTCGGYGIVHFPGHYVPGEQFVEPPSDERCEDCVGTGMREVQERLRAAAPEGVDAADELSALVEPDYIQDGVQGWLVGGGLDVERDATGSGDPTIQIGGVEHPPRRVRALRDALIAALDDAPDGMDAEAQGEMADQLAAAQAAIQRVRDLAGRWERGTNVGILRHVAVVGLLRALDDDTTEES